MQRRVVVFCEIGGDLFDRCRAITALQNFDSDRVGLEHAFGGQNMPAAASGIMAELDMRRQSRL